MTSKSLSFVAELPASIGVISLISHTADVEIQTYPGKSGQNLSIFARTSMNWSVTNDGTIAEVGGPFADALREAGDSASTSIVDGVLHLCNRPILLPEKPERLVVLVPSHWQGALRIKTHYLGHIDVKVALNGNLTVDVAGQAAVTIADQPNRRLSGALLTAGQSGVVRCGVLETKASGSITFGASQRGQVRVTGSLVTGFLKFQASQSGLIKAENGRVRRLDITAVSSGRVEAQVFEGLESGNLHSSQGGYISAKSLWMPKVTFSSQQAGDIQVGSVDVSTISVQAGQGGKITVQEGSCDGGTITASMGGNVSLKGDFGRVAQRQTMGGRSKVVSDNADTKLRFIRAAKRGFNYQLLEDRHSSLIALALAEYLLPLLQQNMSEDVGEPLFIQSVCEAMKVTFKNKEVVSAITACGDAFREIVGPIETQEDRAKLAAGCENARVQSLFGEALSIFGITLVNDAFEQAKAK